MTTGHVAVDQSQQYLGGLQKLQWTTPYFTAYRLLPFIIYYDKICANCWSIEKKIETPLHPLPDFDGNGRIDLAGLPIGHDNNILFLDMRCVRSNRFAAVDEKRRENRRIASGKCSRCDIITHDWGDRPRVIFRRVIMTARR
ncbi:hypothetical protein QTP88_028279 [Uroleucon formosanum]